MLREPGPELDQEVARRLGVEDPSGVSYSTDSEATEDLIARLEKFKVYAACERFGTLWYCALSTEVGRARERLATGTGKTRAIALCRAILNLPPERLQPAAAPRPSRE